jgi:hypothetical protein
MKSYMIALSLAFILAINSCTMNAQEIELPGKIAVWKYRDHDCVIYIEGETAQLHFKARHDDKFEQGSFTWLNKTDNFLGTELLHGTSSREDRSSIVQFDLSGKVVGKIYDAQAGELAWPLYSSWDDKYFLFTTHSVADPKLYPFEGLTPMLSLVIMDLEQRRVITTIDSIGRSPNFLIEESPWLHTGYRFIYSIDGGTQLELQNSQKIINPVETTEGVYIYEVTSGKRKLLVSGGRSAIASPTDNQIAYEKNNSVRVLNLDTNQDRMIYEYGSKETLRGKHWTPDGKYIYFAYSYRWGIADLFHTGEKLIEVSTGKEKHFKKIGHGFESYTWK